ncbi:hypothetical protein BH11MYX3_BH11MYX3_23520 [soil metagenome]
MRSFIIVLPVLFAGCVGSLDERLDEPDVAISGSCSGSTEVEVSGTVVDVITGAPIAGASVELTQAWTSARSFPRDGCRLGGATTDAAGRFGPVLVRATDDSPTIVMLVTGAGRAPTIADRDASCLFDCRPIDERIEAPSLDLATRWRQDLYDGGMEYALNRGLVAYTFMDHKDAPSPRVTPGRINDDFLFEGVDERTLEPGSEVRFLGPDRATLADPGVAETTPSGRVLIGSKGDASGYFRVEGKHESTSWPSVGVIVATGWIYVESGHVE